jgi:uncharacterized protein
MATTKPPPKGPAPRLSQKLAERLTERPGLPHQEHWTEGTEVEPPRRQMAAGHVIIVGIVALLVGAFLNAPGLLQTAKRQPVDSFRRDFGLFFAEPLDDVSGFLQISRPHQWLEDWILADDAGRSARALPTPTTTAPDQEQPATPARKAPTAAKPLRMWCGGDSLAQVPCDALIEQATGTGVITSVAPTESQVSTGLARPEVYNWPARLTEVTAGMDPGVTVIMFGANDDQSLTNPDGGGAAGPFGTAEWDAQYASRVGGMMDQILADKGGTIVWVGIPPINNEPRNGEYRHINEIYRSEAAKRAGRVEYVDTYSRFSTPEGTYTDFVACPPGTEPQSVRTPDQVHFNPTGGNCLASEILKSIDKLWNYTEPDSGQNGNKNQ